MDVITLCIGACQEKIMSQCARKLEWLGVSTIWSESQRVKLVICMIWLSNNFDHM